VPDPETSKRSAAVYMSACSVCLVLAVRPLFALLSGLQ
jgi:hypothetical protein